MKKRGLKRGIAIAVLLLLPALVGDTVAYLSAKTAPAENQFVPPEVEGQIEEVFENNVKKSVRVHSNSDIEVYARVSLIPYWADAQSNPVAKGEWSFPESLGENWVKYGDYYYYTLPVEPYGYTGNLLAQELPLSVDSEGNRMALDFFGEVIQAMPPEAVQKAWGVSISQGKVEPCTQEGQGKDAQKGEVE